MKKHPTKSNIRKRVVAATGVLILTLSTVISLIPAQAVQAAISYDTLSRKERFDAYAYAIVLEGCFSYAEGTASYERDAEKVGKGQLFWDSWGKNYTFTSNETILNEVANFRDGDDYLASCGADDGELSKKALTKLGITGIELVCAMGYKRIDGSACSNAESTSRFHLGELTDKGSEATAKYKSVIKRLTGLDIENPGDDILYLNAINRLDGPCGVDFANASSTAASDFLYKVNYIDSEGNAKEPGKYSGAKKLSEKVFSSGGTSWSLTCQGALERANSTYDGYKKEIERSAAEQICTEKGYKNVQGGSFPGVSDLSACIDGVVNKSMPETYCDTAWRDGIYMGATIDKSTERAACMVGQGLDPPLDNSALDPAAGEADDVTNRCVIETIGWIVCPVLNFMAGVADATYAIIEQFLKTDHRTLENNGAAYTAWTYMRNIANVALVITFIILIYSQLTGVGVSNYGIKKTLPRLIIVAVLINISFFVVQLAVDLSNILGTSLKAMMDELPIFNNSSGGAIDQIYSGSTFFTDLATGILVTQTAATAVGGAIVAGYFLGVGIFIPVIVGAVVALAITFFILLARQMLIILLAIIAPLAFVAMLLPNTERWFKTWQKMFIGLLLVYPAIALLFGASQLAAGIIAQTGNDTDIVWKLAGAAVAIVPLFFTPILLKGSLNAVPAIGNMARELQKKAVGASKSGTAKGVKWGGERIAAGKSPRAKKWAKRVYGYDREGRLRQAAAKRSYEEPRMKDLMLQWTEPENGKPAIAYDEKALAEIVEADPHSFKGQAALGLLAQQQRVQTLGGLREKFESDPKKLAAYDTAIQPHYAALKAKDPSAVMHMGSKEWGEVKQADMHNLKDHAIKAGLKSSTVFRKQLKAALSDPEQKRHFSDEVQKLIEPNGKGGYNIDDLPPAADAAPSPGPGASPGSGSGPTGSGPGPSPGGGAGPGGSAPGPATPGPSGAPGTPPSSGP